MADSSLLPAKPAKKRGPGKPFTKGQSGNPEGRPKLPTELRERAQAYAVEMLDTLRALAINEDEKGPVRVAAAVAVLDRAYGKPVAPIVATTAEMSWAELIEASMERRAERESAASATIEHLPDPHPTSNS